MPDRGGVEMIELKLPPLPESIIDGLASNQWPNGEWLETRYLKFARAVEAESRAAVLRAVAEWLEDAAGNEQLHPSDPDHKVVNPLCHKFMAMADELRAAADKITEEKI